MQDLLSSTALPSFDEILADNPGWLDEGVPTPEAARITGTPQPSLETMRTRGGGPVFIKRGHKVLYTRRALFEWLRAGQRTSTSDPGYGATRAEPAPGAAA